MQQRKLRGLPARAAVNVIALLLLGLLLSPLEAAAQTPPVVPTSICSSGPGIQIGDTCYAPPGLSSVSGQQPVGGYQVLVLNRATLQQGSAANKSFGTNFPGNISLTCQQLHVVLTQYLASLDSSNLVFISSIGDPGFVSPFPNGPCPRSSLNLGVLVESLGGTAAVASATSYALIGVPGLGFGNGWELSNQTSTSGANITGYLVQDANNNYTFLSSAFVKVVTRTTDSSGNPAIQVGSTSYTAPALPTGALGGYQVVVLDRLTLQAQLNQSLGTNFGQELLSCQLQAIGADVLASAVASTSDPILIVSSIGDPGAILDPGQCDLSAFPSLADVIQGFGGTGAGLGAGTNYSLISALSSTGLAPEASSLITPGTQAQLTAILQPNNQSLYTPVTGDLSGLGAVNYDLYTIIAQPPSSWPMPDTSESQAVQAAQAAALQYISYRVQGCPLPNSPPMPPTSFPACASVMPPDCANVRAQYCNSNFQPDAAANAVLGLSYTDTTVPPGYRQQFSAKDFADVQTQLAGSPGTGQLGELQYVSSVFSLLTNTKDLINDLVTDQNFGLEVVLNQVISNTQVSMSSNATLDSLEAAQGVVYFASALAELGAPEIQAVLGLTGTAIQVGLDLTTSPGGGSGTTVQAKVEELAAKLFEGEGNVFAQSLIGVGQLFSIVLTDWNKLQQVGEYVQQGAAGWVFPLTTGSLIQSMGPAFQISFYQSLLPLVADIVFFENVPFSNPSDYQYSTQQCERCLPVCHMPYAGVPSVAYVTTGGSGSKDIYLLDPFPSSTLASQLFNSPTDGSSAGLGIFKPQLFQRIRGWNGLNQVRPVNWPDGVIGCTLAAPAPLLLRGKAEKVGSGTDKAKVSLAGKVALTEPIDLSSATLTLQQVLTEADGAGELVRGAGGAQFLPVQLTAARGSKTNEAVFHTAPRVRPIITLQVKNRDPKKGQLEVNLKVERATVPQPQGCSAGGNVSLRTRFILDDQVNAPFALNVEQPWQCKNDQLTTP